MAWHPNYVTYLGQDTPGRTASSYREHRGPIPGAGPIVRDRGQQPPSPSRPRPDDRIPIPPQQPDPRMTTRPEDLRPRDRYDRDDRDARDRQHPRFRHNDYVFVPGYDWWPRWYPYWDPYWYSYWQYLYSYYRGDEYPEYAEWARDAYLRSIAPQWGWF